MTLPISRLHSIANAVRSSIVGFDVRTYRYFNASSWYGSGRERLGREEVTLRDDGGRDDRRVSTDGGAISDGSFNGGNEGWPDAGGNAEKVRDLADGVVITSSSLRRLIKLRWFWNQFVMLEAGVRRQLG